MIKNCIIYTFSKEFKNKWYIDENKINQSKLADCIKKARGVPKPKVRALIELAQQEKLSLLEETKEHYIFTTSCEFRVPKLLAAGASPYVPVNFNIWLRKESSLVITFDAGRKLSGVGITLLSYATTGTPSSIEHIQLNKNDFLELKNWLLSGEYSNQIRRITLQNIEYEGRKFKQIVLSANQLEDSSLFNNLLDSSQAVANMSFITPPLDSSKRPLSCRINHWGGITIYSPNLLDSEISELIGIFEKLFHRNK
ncbi:MAG: hypothetical protein ACTSRS_21560 [Candidatus Helarchaeota archaeon]